MPRRSVGVLEETARRAEIALNDALRPIEKSATKRAALAQGIRDAVTEALEHEWQALKQDWRVVKPSSGVEAALGYAREQDASTRPALKAVRVYAIAYSRLHIHNALDDEEGEEGGGHSRRGKRGRPGRETTAAIARRAEAYALEQERSGGAPDDFDDPDDLNFDR